MRGAQGGKRPRTTTPSRRRASVDDLGRRQFRAPEPNRLWVADITYVPTREGFLFLAAVIDAFSRRCVGCSMRADLKAELVLDALRMAITQRRSSRGLIHHSDRGSQYTRLAFGKTLADAGVLQSVGRRGDAFDNAVAESSFATLETELFARTTFTSRDHARVQAFDFIQGFYNPRRRHSTLGFPSPVRYEEEWLGKENHSEEQAAA